MREIYATQLAITIGFLILVVAVIFALVQSPEILAGPERAFLTIPHSVEGYRRSCDKCHGLNSVMPYPIRHLGWNNESCTKCHGWCELGNVKKENLKNEVSTCDCTSGSTGSCCEATHANSQ